MFGRCSAAVVESGLDDGGRHPGHDVECGVPVEVRDEIYGHLYLADPREDAFSPEDQVLVEALVAGDPERYEREWRRVSRPYRVLTGGLLAARRSPLARVVVPAAAAAPWLFGRVVDRLAG